MKNQPLVSVFLPTYNQQNFIAASIDSVVSQDYDNLEIVIGDDCSQDNTWEVVQIYQSKYPKKIKAFRNHQNLGITGNCNQILKQCTGKYVAFTAGDDLFLPKKISTQVELMEANEKIVLSYHDIEVFRSKDNFTIRYWNHGEISAKPVVGLALKVAKAVIEDGNDFMAAMSVMVKREAIPLNGFDSRVPLASDWLMWIEILANSGKFDIVEFIPDTFARYRQHDKNITAIGYGHSADEYVTLSIVEVKYPNLLDSIIRGLALIRYRYGIKYIQSGSHQTGRQFLLSSMRSRWITLQIFYWLAVTYLPVLLKLRRKRNYF